jgi:PAS domain S-box-containing protein
VSGTTKDDGKADAKPAMSARAKMLLTFGGVAVFAAVGIFLMLQFADAEREREMRQWQSRMAIVVDSRFTDIDRWITRQVDELRGIADNASVQLYVTVFHEAGAESGGDDAQAELGYLGNLLEVVADRGGFTSDDTGPRIDANVQRVGTAGLALIDLENFIVVSTGNFPPLQGEIRAFLERTEPGVTAVSDVFLNDRDQPSMAFVVPVYAVQADESADNQLGYVLGVKEIAEELYPLLEQPGATEETAEALIVRQTGNQIDYLTPRGEDIGPLAQSIPVDTPNLAAKWAVDTVGGFATRVDYDGNEVLAISRGFNRVPWTLMYKVDTAEALAESENRLQLLMIVFAVIIVLVLIGMLALWYYGTSQRASEAAAKFEEMATRFQGQRNFMHLVTDSQPNAIVIIDEDGHYRWFNKTALDLSRMDRKDMFDKHVSAILGPIEGKRIAAWVKEALAKNERLTVTHEMELGNDGPKVYRSDFQPLPPREDFPPGVLMVSQDITESVQEREKREAAMRQLVGTLVSVVDRRDPYSANHSVRVGEVARAVAKEMETDRVLTETAAIAGSLMNLGKIAIPEEVLTKQGGLTDEEVKMIQNSVLTSADLVKSVDFDGPVYDTLRQLQENFDGSGTPEGKSGKDIVLPARISAVANAFVGMVSARAWRSGMSFDKAMDILLSDGNKKFDRAVVVALANYIDNRGGRDEWASFGDPPPDDGDAPPAAPAE